MNSSLSDSIYGMEGYDWHGKVIGGRIKSAPSDFVVIELDGDRKVDVITYEESNSGLFLAGKVWKKQIDHGHMIKLIAKNFGVQEDDISTAGIKDAYAETTQLFSVYQPRKIPVDPFQPVLNLEISNYHYRREKVFPGSMGGNYFKIKITDCNIIDVSELDEFGRWARKGVLNYFGYQRFGSSRPITAQMGRLLLQKKYEDAINLYLGAVSSASNDQYRKLWRDTGDPDHVLLNWLNIPQIEKNILLQLSKRPTDYQGAMKAFPTFLINIFNSSFISLLANNYLRKRGMGSKLMKGEREIHENIEIALPSKQWKQPLNNIWEEVFQDFDINIDREFKSTKHSSRFLKSYVRDWKVVDVDENYLITTFKLGVGCYATTALREIMQSPPEAYFR